MLLKRIDLSALGRARVYLLTVLGTLLCIAVAIALDGYSFEDGTWSFGARWYNNIIIPLVLAPPLFYLLLSKLRDLAVAQHELMTIARPTA